MIWKQSVKEKKYIILLEIMNYIPYFSQEGYILTRNDHWILCPHLYSSSPLSFRNLYFDVFSLDDTNIDTENK